VLGREIDQDVYGVYREGGWLEIAVLFVRRGRMVGSRTFGFDEQATPDGEVLSTFCNLFYHGGNHIPDEVLLPVEAEAADALVERLTELKGRRVEVRSPQRGAGRRLVEMATRNAEQAFFQARRSDAVTNAALVALKKRLRLSNLPNRIECYDISLFQGASPVASRVVFEGGVPKRSDYRHYKIREVEGTDDFAMMREVLTRRLKRGLVEEDLPDLIVVDGGKGQLGVATAVFEDLGIQGVDVCGLAKSRVLEGENEEGAKDRSPERVFLPGVKDPIVLRWHTDELFLMERLRDEAHRFAITFHRKLRTGRNFESALDEVPGIGPARKRALLQAFGSVKRLREASEAELAAVPGIGAALAREVLSALAR
jgi:excinuclease ABC subunit C